MSDPYTWQLIGADGASVVRTQSGFPSQADAEAWLSEDWRELSEEGITAVTLVQGDAVVYGPMSLEEQA